MTMGQAELCRSVAALIIAVAACGCATVARSAPPGPDGTAVPDRAPAPARTDSLETFVAKVRALSAAARPAKAAPQTLEASDSQLAAALATALSTPSPDSYRQLAAEYRRAGVFDRAHQYLQRALTLNPADAAAHDAIARLWRDSGFPQLGLTDAYRAVFYAPRSAAASWR